LSGAGGAQAFRHANNISCAKRVAFAGQAGCALGMCIAGFQFVRDASVMDAKTSFAQGQLRSFIERIERLEEEKKAIAADIKEVYGEAKATGFDTKIMRKVVTLRKKDSAERQEEEALLDLYLGALGMVASDTSGGGDADE
jgi:uncharacterized protein (UPF0335 family)